MKALVAIVMNWRIYSVGPAVKMSNHPCECNAASTLGWILRLNFPAA
jgi:hypothetical protein